MDQVQKVVCLVFRTAALYRDHIRNGVDLLCVLCSLVETAQPLIRDVFECAGSSNADCVYQVLIIKEQGVNRTN